MAGLVDAVAVPNSQISGNVDELFLSANEITHVTVAEPPPLPRCEDTASNEICRTLAVAEDEYCLLNESIRSDSQKLEERESENSSACSSSLIQHFQGYKAVILIASFFFYVVNCGIALSAGVYFIALQEEFEAGSSITSLTTSLYSGISYLTAPFSSLLVDRLGFRVVVMTGGIIATIGVLATAFANSFYVVLVTVAIIAPIGAGLAYVPAMTIPAAYYDERGRAFALPFASVGCGIGGFVITNVLAETIEAFTWRGSMFISAGLTLQIVAVGALMRTPNMRRKIKPKENDERSFSCGQIIRIYKNSDLVMFFLHYTLITCGLSVIFGHITAVTETLPGVSKQQAALPLSMIGLSMIIGRVATGVIGQLKCVDVFLFYCIASLASGAVIMSVPVVSDFAFTVICIFVFGLLLAPYGSLYNIVILYFCDMSDLNAAFAQMTLLSGFGFMAGAPLAGWLYEVTGYYGSSIYLGGALILFSSLLLIWPYMSYRRRHANDATIIGDQVKALSVGSKSMIGR